MWEASERLHIPLARLRPSCAKRDSDTKYVSDKDAIGLMQLMPATYQELRVEHGLKTCSLCPREDILAGAAPSRRHVQPLLSAGFLAADNAGPYAQRSVREAVRRRPRSSILWLSWRQNSASRGPQMRQRPRRSTRRSPQFSSPRRRQSRRPWCSPGMRSLTLRAAEELGRILSSRRTPTTKFCRRSAFNSHVRCCKSRRLSAGRQPSGGASTPGAP